MKKSQDLVGMQFGRLLVLRKTNQRKYRKVVWECLCECGNTVFIIGSNMTSGVTKSCGCLQKEGVRNMARDLAGQRFGKLTVIQKTDKRNGSAIIWECRCDCGKKTFVRGNSLTSGRTKSCGCGKYKTYTTK